MALSKEDKEFIKLSLAPIAQRLDGIQETNKKHEDRLEKLENENRESEKVFITMDEWVKTRGLTCPNNPRIEEVEKVQEKNKVTKKFVIKVGALVAGVITSAWALVQIISFLAS